MSVLVTVDDAPTKPPYNCKVVVVKDPRAVTSASVEVTATFCVRQLVPFARQTGEPFTKTALAFSVEPLALLKPSQTVEVTAPRIALFAFNVLMVPLVASKFDKVEVPTTVKVEVTVEEAPTNPPYSCKVVVENDPRAVTEASVSTSASKYAGQFVPLVRHTV